MCPSCCSAKLSLIAAQSYLLHLYCINTNHWKHACSFSNTCVLHSATNCLIVTDNERAIIESNFPTIPHFLCFSHVPQDAKRWLCQHGAQSTAEITYYLDCIWSLWSCDRESAYKDSLIVHVSQWSQPFAQWFTDNVHPMIQKLGVWSPRVPCHCSRRQPTSRSRSTMF